MTTWVDIEGIMLSEICQTNIISYDFTNMWNLKNKINREAEQKLTNTYREHYDGFQMDEGWENE